jgi:hypothetical protein
LNEATGMTLWNRGARLLALGTGYFGWVFGAGFALGTVRVFWVVPRIGARAAELLEMPLMLAVITLASGWVERRIGAGPARDGLVVGTIALALLLSAEVATGVALRGQSVWAALVDRDPVSGALYYASLLYFAASPWVRRALHAR